MGPLDPGATPRINFLPCVGIRFESEGVGSGSGESEGE